jgi:integrase/recombinase XerD
MKTEIALSQAIEGYLLDAHARHLSPKTIADYTNTFNRFRAHIGDPPLASITPDDIRHFLADLGSRTVSPVGVAPRPARKLSKKTIRNVHIGLSALWTWAIKEGFVTHHVVRAVRPPKPEKPAIEPFSKADVEAMLKACERSQSYARPGKRECDHARPTADRDRAMILLLLDTGVRASELCADPKRKAPGLFIQDVDQRNLTIKVMGKGDKERIVPISHRTSKAIWRYLLSRPDAPTTDPLFTNQRGGPLTSSGLLQLIRRLGQRAGISNAHPHRFRHTFAINFLRNGGNSLELQRLLGHSTLEMVKRYVALAQVDLENAHRRASPVTNWRL